MTTRIQPMPIYHYNMWLLEFYSSLSSSYSFVFIFTANENRTKKMKTSWPTNNSTMVSHKMAQTNLAIQWAVVAATWCPTNQTHGEQMPSLQHNSTACTWSMTILSALEIKISTKLKRIIKILTHQEAANSTVRWQVTSPMHTIRGMAAIHLAIILSIMVLINEI